jgi:hypothetical protein
VSPSSLARRWKERPNARVAVFLFLLLFGFYALWAGGHTYSSDEEGYLQQARALAHGGYAIDVNPENVAVVFPVGGRDGKPVAGGGIGTPMAAVPLVWAGEAAAVAADDDEYVERVFAGFTNTWVTALIGAAVFLLALELGASRRAGVLLALVYGVGTMAWPHAKTLFSEPLTALLVTVGVLGAVRAVNRRCPWAAAVGGLAIGASVLARASTLPFVAVVALYLVVAAGLRFGPRGAARVVLPFAAGAGASLLFVLATNRWRTGDSTATGYGAVPFDHPVTDGLQGLLLSPGKSIFVYAPVALVTVAGVWIALRRKPWETVMMGAIILGNLVIYARFPHWHGDQSYGTRYMQIVLPLIVAMLAPVVARWRWRQAVVVAGAVGVLPAFLGAVMYFNQYFIHAAGQLGGAIVDGEPRFITKSHDDPSWSPPVGHAKLLDDVVRQSARRVDGVDVTLVGPAAFPFTTNDRYFWYFNPPQLDAWWYWVFPADGPKGLLLLFPVFVGTAGAGLRGVRRSLRA